jgi:phosphatidylinositol alpha-1,6-mannosyltransferase
VKVIIFTRDFPPEFGGVQTLMERIAAFHGADALVIARHAPGDAAFDRAPGVTYRVRRMPRLDWTHANPLLRVLLRAAAYLLRFIIGGIYLGEAVRTHRAELVYCAYAMANGLPMLVVRALAGCPYCVYCHGTETLRTIDRGGLPRLAMKLVLRFARRVIVHSGFMRDEVARLVPAEKIVVNRLGADSGALDPSAPPAAEMAGVPLAGKKVLLTVGRLETRKGHDRVAEALPAVLARHPETIWFVVGDGPDRGRLGEIVARLHLEAAVVFCGRLSDADVSRLLARADLFVMPSRRIGPDVEAFGIVFLEAARFGVPSIGGRSGGVPDAIDDGVTGLLADPESSADVAEKIIRLLDDEPLRRRLGEAARERAAQRTWRACVEQLQRDVEPPDAAGQGAAR